MNDVGRIERLLHYALSCFLLIIPLNDIPIIQPFPVIERFTVGMMLGAVVGFLTLALVTDRGYVVLNNNQLVVMLFFLWTITSVLWSINLSLSILRVLRYVFSAVVVFSIWQMIDKHDVTRLLQILVFGAFLLSLQIHINWVIDNPFKLGRFSGGGFGPNGAGGLLSLFIPVSMFLTIKDLKNNSTNIIAAGLNSAFIPASFSAIVLTGSRHALVAAVCACSVYLLYLTQEGSLRIKRSYLVPSLGASLVFFTSLLFALPGRIRSRVSQLPADILNLDLHGRIPRWQVGIERFFNRPLLGHGAGTYHEATRDILPLLTEFTPPRYYADNVLISALVNLGSVGTIILGVIVVTIFRRHLWKGTKIGGMWIGVFTGLIIISFMNPWLYRPTTWVIIALAMSR